ncbi:MAG TPA: carbon-nitrogen hydrolase family protein [Pirellulales bacterium]
MDDQVLAAVVQMNSGADKTANCAAAGDLIAQAARRGARLVVLPELFNCLASSAEMLAAAEPIPGATSTWLGELARTHRIVLVGGSICEAGAAGRAYNSSLMFGPDGRLLATYRKLHLFDVDLPGQVTYRESSWLAAGSRVVVADTAGGRLGLAICYDLRFGRLFDALIAAGAEVLAIPAAFTAATGRDHWEILIRARAIECQAFVLAANQSGQHTPQFATWGHSAIVDPWGRVLAQVDEGVGIAVAALDFTELRAIRARLPALAHRRAF